MNTPAMAKPAFDVIEKLIEPNLTLIYMPDLNLCDFHLKAKKSYLVHFMNPIAFGMEFAIIREGNNVFNLVPGETTECYLFEETRLNQIVNNSEGPGVVSMMAYKEQEAGTLKPCTGPIVIPPTKTN